MCASKNIPVPEKMRNTIYCVFISSYISFGYMRLIKLQYKMLLTAIWKDWSTDSHSNEFHIMAEYAKKGALLSWLDCGRMSYTEMMCFHFIIHFTCRCN